MVNKIYIIKLIILYGFFLLGGLWHLLDRFQTAMQYLSAPALFAISLLLIADNFRMYTVHLRVRFILWCFFIVITGFLIEAAGNKTGFIFGDYHYGMVLQPKLLNVPVVMGFAWLSIQLSSTGFVQHVLLKKRNVNLLYVIIFTALCMVFFDRIMEPAALKLRYWIWYNDIVPLKNYITWFIISILYSLIGWRLGVLNIVFNKISVHTYIVQIIYFSLVNLKCF